ncbi:hypothetical protein B0H21DRAFT_726036 [Amylocystis lapponica]|nr:hypothetical protein B0H21DRAFT_726036 [Amylocystis lapponica]
MYVQANATIPPLPPLNVHDFLFRRPDVQNTPDYLLYVDGVTGHKQTYRQFLQHVYDGATALCAPFSEGGLELQREGEMVGILSHNFLEYPALIHSLLAVTTPYALLPSSSTQRELTALLRLAKATRLFVEPGLLQLAQAAAEEIGLPTDKVYVLSGNAAGWTSFSEVIERVQSRGVPHIAVRPAQKDTLAHLVFSSGTSGLPKAVAISHGNLLFSLMQYVVLGQTLMNNSKVQRPPATSMAVTLASLPLYHSYGLFTFTFRNFLRPSTLVFMQRWDTDLALKLIPKYRITNLALVPSQIHQLVHSSNVAKADLSSVSDVVYSAAHLPPQLGKQLTRHTPGVKGLLEGYGMSEATISVMLRLPSHMTGENTPAGGTGTLLAGMEARILREDGSEAGYDEAGELFVRGGNVALGYWGDEAATRETFLECGWLRTGDHFRVDRKGWFYFAERAKDTLKISGVQVSPSEIEDVLLAEPDRLIVDTCVAGVSGGRTSDEKNPRAWIVLSDAGRKLGADAVITKLDAWTRQNLSKHKWVRGGFEVIREIPKNATGKALRRVLVERYEQQAQTRARL